MLTIDGIVTRSHMYCERTNIPQEVNDKFLKKKKVLIQFTYLHIYRYLLFVIDMKNATKNDLVGLKLIYMQCENDLGS